MGVGKNRDIKTRPAPASGPDDLTPSLARPPEWWRSLSENAANIITVVSPEGIIEYINHPVAGLSVPDVVGRKVSEFVDPAFHDLLFEKLGQVLRTRETTSFTSRATGPHGTVSWYDNQLSPVVLEGRVVSVAFIATDITTRLQTEERLRRILGSISEIVFETDRAGVLRFANEAGFARFGYTREEFEAGLNIIELLEPEDRERAGANIARILQGEDIGPNEYVLRTKMGDRIPALIYTTPLMDGDAPSGLLGVIVDVSSLRRAEEERSRATETLRAERDRIRTILDLVGDIVLVLETDGTVGVVNRQGCEILGYPLDEIVGRNWFDHFLPERLRDEVRAVFSKLFTGEIELVRVHQNPIRTASGEERQIEWRNSALYDEKGGIRNIISSGTDITDRENLERRLRQAQNLEAIGRLAGGIAHDFNNLLTVITGSVELARAEPDPSRIERRLETIAGASQAAAELTTQLLTFSSRQPVVPVLTRLDRAVTESMRILRRTISEDIVLRITHRESDLPVVIDPGQLSQIQMNLVLNARDAMPTGGVLTVETDRVELTAEKITAGWSAVPGPFARLVVSDTGQGMDDVQKTQLFEPFFTTKEPGKGTGLGMATVYGIVNQCAGLIDVESTLGAGTTVSVYLPVAASEPSPAGSTGAEGEDCGGKERIVLVEDDTAVKDLAVEILTEKGYSVSTFTDPGEALAALAGMTEEGLPDLLITDVVMPGMSGVELVRRLEEMARRPRVLLMSGYTDDALTQRGFSEEHYQLLSKPFTARQLCARVREILDR